MLKENEVVIHKVTDDLEKEIRGIFDSAGGIEQYFKSGETVLLKPNLFAPKGFETGAVTNPEVVRVLIKLLKEIDCHPFVGDGCGAAFDCNEVFKASGYDKLCQEEHVGLFDLNTENTVEMKIPNPNVLESIHVAKHFTTADKVVNIPAVKTHMQTMVTLSLKNIKGLIPPKEKLRNHIVGIHKSIVDINKVIKCDMIFIDGTVGMEGNGPSSGHPVNLNVIGFGLNPVSVDSALCDLMKIDKALVKHLMLASEQGLGNLEYELKGPKIVFPFKKPAVMEESFVSNLYTRFIHTKIGNFVINKTFLGDLIRKLNQSFAKENKARVMKEKCRVCKTCLKTCLRDAITIEDVAEVDKKKCVGCMACIESCPYDAIELK